MSKYTNDPQVLDMRFAFVSRHKPTKRQHELASEKGIELIPIGDRDAFSVIPSMLDGHKDGPFDGVVVVHPAAALRLANDFLVGVFKNANRAPVGEKPTFEAVELWIFDLVG